MFAIASKNPIGAEVLCTDNLAVIQGQKTLNANDLTSSYAQTSWNIDYPTGFTKDNCIVVAFQGSLGHTERYGAYGVSPFVSTTMALGTLPRTATLQDENIILQFWNPADTTKEIKYKLVLLKLPEPDISNYEMGDVNMDGHVTSTDTDLVTGFLNSTNILTDKQFKLADMNSDDTLDSDDIFEIQKKANNNN